MFTFDADLHNNITWFDMCHYCNGTDFFQDDVTWERTCTGCGVVSCYEFSDPVQAARRVTYHKHLYFLHSILPKIVSGGAALSRADMEQVTTIYKLAVERFYDTQKDHKRKNFINSHFVLDKICARLYKEDKYARIRSHLRIPKLKKTRDALEKLWVVIDPFTHTL
jgi:hypothetical protein